MVCLNESYHFKLFKGCLPQILFGTFLATLSRIILQGFFLMYLQTLSFGYILQLSYF